MSLIPRILTARVCWDKFFSSFGGAKSGITTTDDGDQTNGFQLSLGVNVVSTAAKGGSAARAPAAEPGAEFVVMNFSGNNFALYPMPGEIINFGDPDQSFTPLAAHTYTFKCGVAGTWMQTSTSSFT